MSDLFLIEKQGLYYRQKSAGYTGIKDEAGRYSFDEAAEIAGPNGPDGCRDGITVWRESEAPDYSLSCCQDVKAFHQLAAAIARAEAAEAEVERLREALHKITRTDIKAPRSLTEARGVARAALSMDAPE